MKEVWQYGSDEKKDPVEEQDGVAPQVAAGGLDNTHRAYIPNDQPKGFIESHAIKNYGWIFTKILSPAPHSPNKTGYVTPRYPRYRAIASCGK